MIAGNHPIENSRRGQSEVEVLSPPFLIFWPHHMETAAPTCGIYISTEWHLHKTRWIWPAHLNPLSATPETDR